MIDEVKETAEIASEVLGYPLTIKTENGKYSIVSGTDRLITVNSDIEVFRALQGMMIGKEYNSSFTLR